MNLFKKVMSRPGEYNLEQARLCRAAAKLALQEGDEDHAKMLESSAAQYEKDALCAIRKDREERAGATPYNYSF